MFRHHLIIGYKLIILQMLMVFVVASISVFISDWRGFVSVLLGGIAWVIPNLYFVHKLFKPKNIRDPQTLFKDFFLGEGIKLLFSAILIIFIIFLVPIKITGFLSGYIAAVAASFLMPFLKSKK